MTLRSASVLAKSGSIIWGMPERPEDENTRSDQGLKFPDLYPKPPEQTRAMSAEEIALLEMEQPEAASSEQAPGARGPLPPAQVVTQVPTSRFRLPRWVGNVLFFGGLSLLSLSLYLKLVEPRSNQLSRTADLPVAGRLVEGKAGPVVSIFGDPNDQGYRLLERQNGPKLSQLARQGRVRIVRYQLPLPTGSHALQSRLAARALLCVDRVAAPYAPGLRIAISRLQPDTVISEDDVLAILPEARRVAVEGCVLSRGEDLLKAEGALTLRAGYVRSPYVALDGVPYAAPLEQLIRELAGS